MSENHFANALRNFTMDAAAGDAIRHLTDKGYTFSQVKDALTFPAPDEYIAEVMWARMVETRKVIPDADDTRGVAGRQSLKQSSTLEKASCLRNSLGGIPATPRASDHTIVETRDRYGRKSFLSVKKESPEENIFSPEDYIPYNDTFVLKSALEQVSSLSDRIPLKVRNTGSHPDM